MGDERSRKPSPWGEEAIVLWNTRTARLWQERKSGRQCLLEKRTVDRNGMLIWLLLSVSFDDVVFVTVLSCVLLCFLSVSDDCVPQDSLKYFYNKFLCRRLGAWEQFLPMLLLLLQLLAEPEPEPDAEPERQSVLLQGSQTFYDVCVLALEPCA